MHGRRRPLLDVVTSPAHCFRKAKQLTSADDRFRKRIQSLRNTLKRVYRALNSEVTSRDCAQEKGAYFQPAAGENVFSRAPQCRFFN